MWNIWAGGRYGGGVGGWHLASDGRDNDNEEHDDNNDENDDNDDNDDDVTWLAQSAEAWPGPTSDDDLCSKLQMLQRRVGGVVCALVGGSLGVQLVLRFKTGSFAIVTARRKRDTDVDGEVEDCDGEDDNNSDV